MSSVPYLLDPEEITLSSSLQIHHHILHPAALVVVGQGMGVWGCPLCYKEDPVFHLNTFLSVPVPTPECFLRPSSHSHSESVALPPPIS